MYSFPRSVEMIAFINGRVTRHKTLIYLKHIQWYHNIKQKIPRSVSTAMLMTIVW